MPVSSYSRTPANNNSAPPNGWPEGMAASAVNDCARQQMTDIVNEAAANAVKVLGSVAGTNTITAAMTPALAAYSAGMTVNFNPAVTNTGAVTINISSLGALDIFRYSGDSLEAGDLVAGIPAYLILDSGADDWYLLNPQNIGFRNVPPNQQNGNYTCVLADNGKFILHTSGAGAGDTYTIPANASVAFPVGAAVTFANLDSNSVSIAITTDTLILSGTLTSGTRTLAANSMATALKVASTTWMISGTGLT